MKKIQIIYLCIFLLLAISTTLVFAVNFDLNNDGVVNITDLENLASHYHGKAAYNSSFDFNNDSVVNVFDVVAIARNVSTGVNEVAPDPSTWGVVLIDTRAGGNQSIQSANNLTQAQSVSGLSSYENTPSGLGVNWTTNADGAGTHAFVWQQIAGVGENNWMIYTTAPWGAYGNATTVEFKYSTWAGRTSTGGGVGTVGDYDFGTGHKRFVLFRYGNVQDGRFTGVEKLGIEHYSMFCSDITAEPSAGGDQDPRSTDPGNGGVLYTSDITYNGTGYDYNFSNLTNQWVTHQFEITRSSANGTADGRYRHWVNGVLVFDIRNFDTGTLGWQELQMVGPTWVSGPARNMTEYATDFVIGVEP